jgi:YggT family protein
MPAIINLLFGTIQILILIRIIFSWVNPSPYGQAYEAYRIIHQLTEPLLEPIRRLIPPINGVLDLSPMILLIALNLIQNFLTAALR